MARQVQTPLQVAACPITGRVAVDPRLYLFAVLLWASPCGRPAHAALPDRDLIDAGSKAKTIILCRLTEPSHESAGDTGVGLNDCTGIFQVERTFKGNGVPEKICTYYRRWVWPPEREEPVLQTGDKLILFGEMFVVLRPDGISEFNNHEIMAATPENIAKILSLLDVFNSKDPWKMVSSAAQPPPSPTPRPAPQLAEPVAKPPVIK